MQGGSNHIRAAKPVSDPAGLRAGVAVEAAGYCLMASKSLAASVEQRSLNLSRERRFEAEAVDGLHAAIQAGDSFDLTWPRGGGPWQVE